MKELSTLNDYQKTALTYQLPTHKGMSLQKA